MTDLREIMPRAEFEKTEMFAAFFAPNKWDDGVRLTIWRGEAGAHTISLLRSAAHGSLDCAERHFLQAIMPHLQRMALIAHHLRGADLLVRSAFDALSVLRQPTLLVDEMGRVVYANLAGEHLLRACDGLTTHNGRLAATHATVARQLDAIVSASTRISGVAGTMRIPRSAAKLPLALVAMPLQLHDVLSRGRPAALICVSDPGLRNAAPEALLTSLFGLTRAEAALAAGLLAGRDVAEIAFASQRSVSTVRNLLARLMAKTDTSRQSELVRMLERLSTIAAPC